MTTNEPAPEGGEFDQMAVGYLRVSTAVQVTDGAGLEVQREAIEAWATATGHVIAAWYADEGESGGDGLDVRLALGDALEAVAAGDAGVLVVYRLDRLARDLIVQETLLAEVWRAGGEVASTSPAENSYLGVGDDPADPSRRLIRQVLGAVAEYERAMIRLRLMAGKRRKLANGGFGGGALPYGWTAVDRELVPVPEEQAVVARVAELRELGLTIRRIAEILNEEGHTAKRGGPWRTETVRRVVCRLEGRPAAPRRPRKVKQPRSLGRPLTPAEHGQRVAASQKGVAARQLGGGPDHSSVSS